MTPADFDVQVNRLNSQWPRTYGQERKALLWQAFKDAHADDFRNAVDACLAGHRAPPLLDQLSTEVDQAKVRRVTNETRRGFGSMYETLETAASNNKAADPEYVQACLKHLRSFLDGKIDQKQFDEGCGFLNDVAKKLDPRGARNPATAVAMRPPMIRNRYNGGNDND